MPALAYRHKLAVLLGGEGSGNFGHAGRPGEVGGSASGGASDDRTDDPGLPKMTKDQAWEAEYHEKRGQKFWRKKDPETGQINHYSEDKGMSGFKQVMSGPYDDEYDAMMGYLDNGYKSTNTFLRERGAKEEVGSLSPVAHLDRLISRNTLDQKATLYRSVNPRLFAKLEDGDTFIDKGFVSTSWKKESVTNLPNVDTKKRIVVAIEVERGQPALEVDQYEGGDELRKTTENEYLLPRGMTFTVVKKGGTITLRAHKPTKVHP